MKTVMILCLLAASVTFVSAQPGCREPFNPFYVCLSDFEHSKYFFYGEIVSIERLKNETIVNPAGSYLKMRVKVKKSFKGNLPEEITLYLGYQFTCRDFAPKNIHSFTIAGGDQKIYIALNLSRPMTDYSEEAVKEVFRNIESVMSNQKKDFIEGAVFEWLLKIRKVSLKSEDADRLSDDFESRQPLANILIEATNEKDRKVYRARSKADGTFRIDSIPNGIYKIKLHLPPGKQQSEPFTYGIDNSPCSRKWYIPVMS